MRKTIISWYMLDSSQCSRRRMRTIRGDCWWTNADQGSRCQRGDLTDNNWKARTALLVQRLDWLFLLGYYWYLAVSVFFGSLVCGFIGIASVMRWFEDKYPIQVFIESNCCVYEKTWKFILLWRYQSFYRPLTSTVENSVQYIHKYIFHLIRCWNKLPLLWK